MYLNLLTSKNLMV